MIDLAVLESRAWTAAGWTMLHFLWVGAVLAIVAAAGRLLLRSAGPIVRYWFALLCLVAMAVAPGVIATRMLEAPPSAKSRLPLELDEGMVLPNGPPLTTADAATEPLRLIFNQLPVSRSEQRTVLETVAACLPWLWLVGTPIVFATVASGLMGAERLRRQSRLVDQGDLPALCRRLAGTLKIAQSVAVRVCDRLASPILLGIVRPIILLPPAALTGWSPEQLEMVLLHELAHVRRWDNLVNLMQRIVESLFFFQPAVWWVSRWVRLEREYCCDALVVAQTGRPYAYAETLAALAIPGISARNAVAAMSEGNLVSRIRRILNLEDRSMKLSRRVLGFVTVVFLVPVFILAAYAAPTAIDDAVTSTAKSKSQVQDEPHVKRAAHQGVLTADRYKLLFTSNRTGNYEIFLINPDGSDAKNLTNNPSEDSGPAWSPDGKKIAFVSDRNGNRNIYVMNADGSNVRQLTTHVGIDRNPAWSRDGKKIAFGRNLGRNWEIFVMDADGSNQINLTNDPARDSGPTWSPNGKKIAFSSSRVRGFHVHVMDADGGNVEMLNDRHTAFTFPAWSPDGKNIAYTGNVMGAREIFVCDADGSNEKQLTTLGGVNTYAAWSPDGKKIAFEHYEKAGENPGTLYIIHANGNVKEVVTGEVAGETFPGHGGGRPAWKPK